MEVQPRNFPQTDADMVRGDDERTALELSMPEHEPEVKLRLGVESDSGREEAETSMPSSASCPHQNPSSGRSVGASSDCPVDVPVLGASKQREVTADGPRCAALDLCSEEARGTNTELPQAAAVEDSEATVTVSDRELCQPEFPVVRKPSENGSRGDDYGVESNEENKYICKIGEFEESTSESCGFKDNSVESRMPTNSHDELADAISKLDISSSGGKLTPPVRELSPHGGELSPREELSESSLESDGDTSDIDSDGPVHNNVLDENRLNRQCNASRGKPYDRPARGRPAPDASPDVTVTPEDDQDLRDFLQGSSDLFDQLFANPSQSNYVNNLNGYAEMTNGLTFDPYLDEQAANTQPVQFCTPSYSEVPQPSLAGIPTVVDEKMNEDESAGKKPKATRRKKKADTHRKPSSSTATVTSNATLTSAAMSTSNGGLELRETDDISVQQGLHVNVNDIRNADNLTRQIYPGNCPDSNGGLHTQAYTPCHQLQGALSTPYQQALINLPHCIPGNTPPQLSRPSAVLSPVDSAMPHCGSINVMSSPQLPQNQTTQILNVAPVPAQPRPQQTFPGMHLATNGVALNDSMTFKQSWPHTKMFTAGFLGGQSQPHFQAFVICPIHLIGTPALAPTAPSSGPVNGGRLSQRPIMPKPM